MDWGSVDERLIRRGEILFSLEFLVRYDYKLKSSDPYILAIRYIGSILYTLSWLEEFIMTLNRLIHRLPSADYSGLRKHILDGPLSI